MVSGDDENVPGKAYVKFIPTETEAKVCYRAKEGPQRGWDVHFVYQEQNGISFTPEKWTAVIFNADRSVRWVRTDMADEISYERLLLPQKPNKMGSFIPVDASIGYGIAVEGVDENGNRLVFHGYIPLSQEEEKVYVPADFQAEQKPEEGKAFLTATPLAEVVTPVYFERDNADGWEMDADFKNTSDVPFTVKGMLSIMFRGEEIVYRNVFLAEQMLYWKELRALTLQPGETFTHGTCALLLSPAIGLICMDALQTRLHGQYVARRYHVSVHAVMYEFSSDTWGEIGGDNGDAGGDGFNEGVWDTINVGCHKVCGSIGIGAHDIVYTTAKVHAAAHI